MNVPSKRPGLRRGPGSTARFLRIVAVLGLLFPAMAWADTAFLGISSRGVRGEDARELGLASADGALIERVYDGTAAESAGLRRDDILIEFAGETVFDDDDLTRLIRSQRPGDSVEMVVLRDGERLTLHAELGSRADYEDAAPSGWAAALESFFGGGRDHPRLGVHVMELNAQLAEYFEVSDQRGVLITQVVRRSPAEEAGIHAGDVVTRVAGSRVYGTGDISDALEGRAGELVTVSLVRKGRPMELQVQLED
ncbi:MAG: PDZ domain-containing protein [Acidobacteriota bacterium]|jgi:serine protease Do